MSAEVDLYTALSSATAVSALVSDRIYPDVVPAGANLPCVAYTRTNTEDVTTIHSAAPVAETAFLEVSCMAASRSAAETVANAVQAAAWSGGFIRTDRRAEFDLENEMWATVLSFEKFTNLS